jgi:hypothetical protein
MTKGDASPKAFSDVGGVVVRQLQAAYEKSSCPNASNAKGELVCEITCDTKLINMRLYVKAPTATTWSAVRGYSAPADEPFELDACVLKDRKPIRLVYRSLDLMIDMFTSSNPSLAALIASYTASNGSIKFKPFGQTANELEKFGQSPEGRSALLRLSDPTILQPRHPVEHGFPSHP